MPDGEATKAAPREAGAKASLAKNALYLVLGQVATTALAIVFSAALGRSLGAGDFGVFFLINSFATFAFVLVDWGQSFFVIREVAQRPERGGRLLGTALALRVAGAALISVPAGLVSWGLGYPPRTTWFSVVFIGASLPFFLSQAYGLVFRGRDRMALDASVSVVNKAVTLVLGLAALAIGWGLPGVVTGLGLGGLVALVVAGRLYRRVSPEPLRADRETAREMMAVGAAIVTMSVSVQVQPYLDAIILSKLAPADAIGWFGAAKNIMGTLLAPAVIVGAAAFPTLSRVAGEPATFTREFRTALRPMLWLGALAGVGTWLFADVAISLVYGKRNFGPAGAILQIFGPGLFLIFVDILLGNALTALGRTTAFAVIKVASVVLSTGLDLWLIRLFQERNGNGGIGAVLAFVISEVVVFTGAVFLMPRRSLGLASAVDLGRALLAAGVTAAIFHWAPQVPFWIGVPACVVLFTGCSLAVGLVHRTDVELFRAALARRLRARTGAAPPADGASRG